jgi:hypothetical protein
MVNFTLDSLILFTQKEEKMIKHFLSNEETETHEPSQASVKNILAYNKALSVRKSKKLKHFKLVLN